MLSSVELFGIVIVVVVCAVLAAVGLTLLRRLRQRRDQLRGELSHRPAAISDRAFNRIAMARREADVLAGQGIEVPRARELVGEAQAAFDARQFDRSYELAQSAHETLVAARTRPPRAAAASDAGSPVPPPGVPTEPGAAPSQVPAHRAEAQFQLRLLTEDVARTSARGSGGARAISPAQALLGQAQAAYDRAEYAEAFRLALKGRREAGGAVEALASAPGGRSGVPAPATAADADSAAEALAAADRCPDCGHPMTADDPFCRGCGSPRAAAA